MAKSPKAVARDKERRALALFVEGKNFTEIAEIIGYYTNGEPDRSTAYETVNRAIKRERAKDVEEVREKQGAQIDALLATLLPVALTAPLEAASEDPVTGQVTVIKDVPESQLKTVDRVVKLLERKARLFGTDEPMKVNLEADPAAEARAFLAGAAEQMRLEQEKREAVSD